VYQWKLKKWLLVIQENQIKDIFYPRIPTFFKYLYLKRKGEDTRVDYYIQKMRKLAFQLKLPEYILI